MVILRLPRLLSWAARQHPETLLNLLRRAREIQDEDLNVAAIFRAGMKAGKLQAMQEAPDVGGDPHNPPTPGPNNERKS